MRNLTKLIVIGVFTLFALTVLINHTFSKLNTTVFAQTNVQPTPPAENTTVQKTSNQNANVQTNSSPVAEKPAEETPKAGDKSIPKKFTLGQDSFSEYGEVAFNHDTHAFQKYSPDGKSVVGCIECHHTDQPKSALKPPLLTSERNEILTIELWKKSSQKVSLCRACHFQDGEIPEGKEMAFATYKDGDKETTKELTNELAYHINCNTCHDAASTLRPELKKKEGFATTNDCMICHKEN